MKTTGRHESSNRRPYEMCISRLRQCSSILAHITSRRACCHGRNYRLGARICAQRNHVGNFGAAVQLCIGDPIATIRAQNTSDEGSIIPIRRHEKGICSRYAMEFACRNATADPASDVRANHWSKYSSPRIAGAKTPIWSVARVYNYAHRSHTLRSSDRK